jgi:YihY family inner membrane protein
VVNFAGRGTRAVDAFQQRHRPLCLAYAVVKKFGDDNAGVLVSSLALSAFAATFPLLLLLVTVLGLVLSSHPGLRSDVLHSAVNKFPIIGNDLAGNIRALRRNSAAGLAVGIAGLLWGSTGLAQNAMFTMAEVWNLPGRLRPNYLQRLSRSLAFLAVLVLGLVVGTFLAGAAPTVNGPASFVVAGSAASLSVNVAEYLVAFRVLTPRDVPLRQLVPGSVLGGAGWTVLQAFGGYVVGHYLKDDSAVYGLFGIVLGLLAWIYLIVRLTVYSAELNVVLARHLWPRTIVQPPLTDADRRSLAAQAEQNERRPEQHVEVTFDLDALAGTESPPLSASEPRASPEPPRGGAETSPTGG